MKLLNLQAIPNQSIIAILDGDRYQLTIVETAGVMSVTILKNDQTVVDNIRATAGTYLMPYGFMTQTGNFIFLNLNDEIVYYTNFGSSQNLFYVTADDISNLRSQ